MNGKLEKVNSSTLHPLISYLTKNTRANPPVAGETFHSRDKIMLESVGADPQPARSTENAASTFT